MALQHHARALLLPTLAAVHVPLTGPQLPVARHVHLGIPVKPLLHLAVHTAPTADAAPQLNKPLAGSTGLFLHTAQA
jgi:hypothetical protein